MFAPDDRRMLLDALVPPDDHALTHGIITTYSLDLDALLLAPAQLLATASPEDERPAEDRIGLIGALCRAASRLSVYCQDGRISEPMKQHAIYGLLERLVVSAVAPRGGSFHPKVWLLRFECVDAPTEPARMRLLVLSRNLTFDRCWDVSLRLDGVVRGRQTALSRPLADFIAALPDCARPPFDDMHKERAKRLAEDVRLVEWELPNGFDELQFHALGIGPKPRAWLPAESDELLVISPFVHATALQRLADTTKSAVALISRDDELQPLKTKPPFERVYVLDERAETDDGEDESASRLSGLHAKIYVARDRGTTRVYVGSANATTAALGSDDDAPTNVELLAELVGRRSHPQVRGIDELLSEDGLMPMLNAWTPSAAPTDDDDEADAERDLDRARAAIAKAGLRLRFERSGELWRPTLSTASKPRLVRIDVAKARLITFHPESAVSIDSLSAAQSVELPDCDIAACTGFLAVELHAERAPVDTRFVLALPTEGLPPDREAHIVRSVIRDESRFLAYVNALLGLEPVAIGSGSTTTRHSASDPDGRTSAAVGAGLLERLLRARARDPAALDEIEQLVSQLVATPDGERLVPPNFRKVWEILRTTELT